MPNQDDVVERKNAQFFADNDRYLQSISEIPTYRNIRHALAEALSGSGRLIDIGNGGVFDYPLDVAEEIVGVDLFVGKETQRNLPPHVRLVKGDARQLPSDIGLFDTAAMVMLLHHLVGSSPDDQPGFIREAVAEASSVLKRGGRLVVVESVVPGWFYRFERRAYRPMYRTTTRSGGHPPAMQLPLIELMQLLTPAFVIERVELIPVGRWLLQFGRRFPAALTPARPVLLVARRAA